MRFNPKFATSTQEKTPPLMEQESCFSLELFREANQLARSGYYEDAEILINQALPRSGALRSALLDLLARVYAQQGRYFDAESCWRAALKLAPGSQPITEGLRAIARERHTSPADKLLMWLLAMSAVVVYFAWHLTKSP